MSRFPYRINWVRLGLATTFYLLENRYFGWNRYPQSPEEVLADGLFLLIAALAFERREQPCR